MVPEEAFPTRHPAKVEPVFTKPFAGKVSDPLLVVADIEPPVPPLLL